MTYWLAVLVLLVLGFLTGFSIGLFVLLVAVAMLVLGPFRHRPLIYWPPMAGVLAFILGYLAVAPLSCEARGEVGGASTTVCSSLIGITYTGTGTYNPSLQPGLVAGLVAALTAALLVALLVWRTGRPIADGRR